MEILAFTPIAVTSEELARRQKRYDRLSPDSVSVRLEGLGEGSHVPRALASPADIEASEQALLARYNGANLAGVDALMPDCILDPTVDVPAVEVDVPVLGLLKMTASFLTTQGLTVGALARNESIATELDRKYASYQLEGPIGGTKVLGLKVEDIANEQAWNDAVAEQLVETKADVVINGCSAVEVSNVGRRPALIDPTALALNLLALTIKSTGAAISGGYDRE